MTAEGDLAGSAPLLAPLIRRIRQTGPLTIAAFMQEALQNPTYGYYLHREVIGPAGDFTTAPEISQMFGELLGLWAVDWWVRAGQPTPVALVELGPGRGTLMADALRAAAMVPEFLAAASVHLLESSPNLRAQQRSALATATIPVAWHDTIESLPQDRPMIVLANEFFDALPIRQFVRTRTGWAERVVALGGAVDGALAGSGERLAFGLTPVSSAAVTRLRGQDESALPVGSVIEVPTLGATLFDSLAVSLAQTSGAALIIDYGYRGPAVGDTLQAMAAHQAVDPLAAPGRADVTSHVDFTVLTRLAQNRGLRVQGPAEQGPFLEALGLHARADRLKAQADVDQQRDVDAAVARLTAGGPTGMGTLFKVLAVTDLDSPVAAGLPTA